MCVQVQVIVIMFLSLIMIENVQVLTGGITEAEWDCYDAYASRIRTLSLVGVPHVAHSVYLTLSLLRTPTPLLPALQSLSIQREDILPALALISPALEHLSLTELTCSDPVPSILAILSRKSPGLRQLTIAGYISWAHLQSLDQLRNLRFLSIQTPSTPHNFNFVRRLLLLPCLRSLHISVQGGVLIKAESLISNTSQLSNLTIMGPYLSLGTLLDMVICPSITNLKSLALVVQYDGLLPPPKSLRSFWKHIYPYMNSLLSLSFRLLQAPGNFEPHVEPCFAMDIMEPLLVFRQLQNLDLRFSHMQPFLYDFQVEVLANAWPSIETLSLPNCSNPTTTADGLANFARSCPCLTKLQVDVNLLKVWKPTLPARTHGLRELTFGRFSVWADTLDTARNLDRLFPALLVVSHDSNVQAHASEGTQYITKALSVFQSIREDERLRYQTAS